MPRLFRESPINSIWEGSGNVQCLDMLRAMNRNPGSLEAFMQELHKAQGKHTLMDAALDSLAAELENTDNIEFRSRNIVGQMALAFQASTLLQSADESVAEAFCNARLGKNAGWVYGSLPPSVDCAYLIERASPKIS